MKDENCIARPPRRFSGYERLEIDGSSITITYRWHEDALEPLDSQWLQSDFCSHDFTEIGEVPEIGRFRYKVEDGDFMELADGWHEATFELGLERLTGA